MKYGYARVSATHQDLQSQLGAQSGKCEITTLSNLQQKNDSLSNVRNHFLKINNLPQ